VWENWPEAGGGPSPQIGPPASEAGRTVAAHRKPMRGAPATPYDVRTPRQPTPSTATKDRRFRTKAAATKPDPRRLVAMASNTGFRCHRIDHAVAEFVCVRCRRSVAPAPGELRVVGVGRAQAPQVRRARASAGRAPTSRSHSRAIAGRGRNTVPEDGAPRAESDGRVFQVPARTSLAKTISCGILPTFCRPSSPEDSTPGPKSFRIGR